MSVKPKSAWKGVGFRLAKRLGIGVFTLWLILSLSYAIMRAAPGKPFESEKNPTPEVLAELRRKYDFTYWQYLAGIVLHGDLRYSYAHRDRTVNEILAETLPISMQLGLLAIGTALVGGLLAGLAGALFRGRWMEGLVMVLALLGIAIPNFVLGTALQLVFANTLHWTQIAGWPDPGTLILPVLALSLTFMAYIARIARSSFLENLSKDYVRTARAKGLSDSRIYIKHLLRNSVQPVVSYLAPATASALTGTMVIERIFNIPGMGRYFVESVFQRDYPLALGVILVYSCFLLALNLVADMVQAWIDPRVELN
jgi:oligopeptide transport system permease protein